LKGKELSAELAQVTVNGGSGVEGMRVESDKSSGVKVGPA
jgi:hypothetical protein